MRSETISNYKPENVGWKFFFVFSAALGVTLHNISNPTRFVRTFGEIIKKTRKQKPN